MTGIYKIENLRTGVVYIGKSVDIKRRKYQHFRKLLDNKHFNQHLQYSFNKHGKHNFSFYVLEKCEKQDLSIRESFWYKRYKTRSYNLNLLFEQTHRPSLEVKNKMRKAKHNSGYAKKFYAKKLGKDKIHEFMSIKEGAKILGVDRRYLQSVLKGKDRLSIKNYIVGYTKEKLSKSENLYEKRMRSKVEKVSDRMRKIPKSEHNVIKELYKKGIKQQEISDMYNVSHVCIYRIISGKR